MEKFYVQKDKRSLLAYMIAASLVATNFVASPYIPEKKYELEQLYNEESNELSRKRTKKYPNSNLKSKRYTFEG